MTPEQLKRAVWARNSPTTLILKCCAKDGGAVLAEITGGRFVSTGYRWETMGIPKIIGSHNSQYGAQREARQAVRETFGEASL